MSGLKFLDEKIIALRNEMREQENHEITQNQSTLTENEQEPKPELQKIDLYQSFVHIDGENIPVIDQSVLEGKITFRMPKLFSIMLPELAFLKYPSERRPNTIYTDDSSTINLAFNMTKNALSEAEVAEFQEDMIDILEQAQPSAEWLDTGVIEINEKTIGFIEVITPAIDGDIFNLMFFASIEGQALIGTFNCMEEDIETWRSLARAMMETLQFAPNGRKGGVQL
ncbi:hypothetical protein CSE16_08965 [Solibacillus sp. R5-41]|uniref:hypothetical protein n=1 Tax=Solibacillus sp. R5-41 TaxID=2048654 RepID=UPI000C1257A5|nr:hypothetical protein [Solibacillus sp. R5-41]ATP40166.1 hypothetical protein CSE16_08965 [Solibacillus sp. R5-41]